MDFGVLDGLLCSQNNNSNKNTLFSCCDLDSKPKWCGSANGFSKQENPVSETPQDEWRNMKMAKTNEDEFSKSVLSQQHRSNDAHNMLSFSSPNTQIVTLPYYARNTTGFGSGGPFTPSQWMELEHQALIYKYITANAAIPANLLIPIKKAFENAALSAYSGSNLKHNTFGWGGFHLGLCNSSDPEPGRCRRTDGKKWRCAKDAVADQKYCERHMNRGRHRSRKPVEPQNLATRPNPAPSSQDNRNVVNKANMGETVLKKNQLSASTRTEFGLVCSDSLLNPLHKSNPKSQNSLRQFMEDWPNSDQAQTQISLLMGPTSERISLSPLRMGLGMGNVTNTHQTNRAPISWESSMGGPLGEALQHSTNNSPSSLNLMTDDWDTSPQMGLSPTGVLQKTAFGHLL